MKWLSFTANQSTGLIIASVFLALTINIQLRANPIAPTFQEYYVSELVFDSSGEWIIELSSLPFHFSEEVDSVCVSTSSGSAKWITENYQEVSILRNEHLDADLDILPEGDFVQVTTYYKESDWWHDNNSITHTLTFGNYPEARVRSPKEGESIVYIPDYYVDYDYEDHFNSKMILIYSNLYTIATGYPNERNI